MNERRAVSVVVAVALAVRLVAAFLPIAAEAPDSIGYTAPAASMVAGRGYLDAEGRPTCERPPGYPALIAASIAIGGSASSVRVAQALLGAATTIIIWLALRARDARAAIVAAAIFAIDPIAIGTVPLILRENLLTFLVALATWLVASSGERRARIAAAGLPLAALVVTHSLYGLLGPFLAIADLARRDARARRLVAWAAAGALVLAAAGAWTLRSRAIGQANLVLTSYPVIAGELWLSSECTNAWLPSDDATGFQALHFAEIHRLQDERGLDGAKAELYRRFFENLATHPLRTMMRMARLNVWYWLEVPGAVRLVDGALAPLRTFVLLPFHWMRLAAAIAGVIALRRARRLSEHRAELAGIAFFIAAPALLYPIPRFLVPACPLLDSLAAIGLVAAWERKR